MLLPIRIYPDPVLRAPAAPVGEVDARLRRLAADMLETMQDADGVGLAATQVGESLRMIAVNFDPNPDGPGDPRVLVNPRLANLSPRKRVAREGCLSFPGLYGEVRRSMAARLLASDLDGNPVELDVEDYLARVLQHEIDHLDNVLFIDRMGPAAKFALREGLAKLEEQSAIGNE